MEKTKKKGGCLKTIGIIFLIIIGLGILGNLIGEDEEVTDNPGSAAEVEVQEEKEDSAEKDKKAAEAEKKAKEEAEAEAKAKAEAEANKPLDQKALDIANDVMGKDNVIEVKLVENNLFYTLEGKDNLTVNMIRTGMHMDASQILEKTSALEGYESVNFVYQMPLVDQYGNEELSDVMSFWLDLETIGKINFDNFSYDNIPNISTDYWQHPALNE